MSKWSLENLKQERINELFNNLDVETLAIDNFNDSKLLGWTWECDLDGNYTACSAEIEGVLNVSVPEILGQPITHLMVNINCHALLDTVSNGRRFPVDMDVQIRQIDGRQVQAKICFLKILKSIDDDRHYGFSGFTQILQENQPASVFNRIPANENNLTNTNILAHNINSLTISAPEPKHSGFGQQLDAQSETDISLQKFRFLTEMGKELRASVNSILGFSRIILKGIDGPITEPLKQDVHAIYDSGIQILDLTDDLITFSKIESGILKLNFEGNINLADMIASVANTSQVFFQENAIELEIKVPSDLPAIRVDPVKTRVILLRLLDIAANLTKSGIITITAEHHSANKSRTGETIHVRMEGRFLLPLEQLNLFNPFFSSGETVQEELSSCKFGFYTAKKLIEMHGGELGIQHDPDETCSIYFTFPVNKENAYPTSRDKDFNNKTNDNPQEYQAETYANTLVEDQENPTIIKSVKVDKTPKILLIDDDRSNIDLMKEVFLHSDELLIVNQGDITNIIKKIRTIKPRAIIINPQMHYLDIQQVLKALTIDPFLKSIPVIILTSNSLDHLQFQLINDSAIVLHKGFITDQDLRKVVSNVMNY